MRGRETAPPLPPTSSCKTHTHTHACMWRTRTVTYITAVYWCSCRCVLRVCVCVCVCVCVRVCVLPGLWWGLIHMRRAHFGVKHGQQLYPAHTDTLRLSLSTGCAIFTEQSHCGLCTLCGNCHCERGNGWQPPFTLPVLLSFMWNEGQQPLFMAHSLILTDKRVPKLWHRLDCGLQMNSWIVSALWFDNHPNSVKSVCCIFQLKSPVRWDVTEQGHFGKLQQNHRRGLEERFKEIAIE